MPNETESKHGVEAIETTQRPSGAFLFAVSAENVGKCADEKPMSIAKKPLHYRAIKRLFDIVFSACVIIIGFIPGLILSVFIVIDTKGSPIYCSTRVGHKGPFKFYKFRTMVADSDNLEKYFTPDQLREWHLEHKVKDDPRITKFGQFIRSVSMASVIIGTPGDGESTKPLSHSTKTSLDQQFCERRPEPVSCVCTHYTSPEFLSFGVLRGFSKGVYGIMGQSDSDGMTNPSHATVPTSLQRIDARYPMPFSRAA